MGTVVVDVRGGFDRGREGGGGGTLSATVGM